jgi:CHAT domain-containing protein
MTGKIHRLMGNAQRALEFHQRALAIARAANNAEQELLSLGHLGNAYLDLGDRLKALDYYEQSLQVTRASGLRSHEGDSLRRMGEVAYLSGDYQKARGHFEGALHSFRSNWDRGPEASTLHRLAQIDDALGNLEQARKRIEEALDIHESLRTNVLSQHLRDAVLTSAQASFALYIDLLMQLHLKDSGAGHDAVALHAAERARARSLLELLHEARADIRQGAAQDLLTAQRLLRQQINAKEAARTRLSGGKTTQMQAAVLEKELAQLTSRYREIEVQIRKDSPRYAALTQPEPLALTGIQQQLDDETVLLEFALGETRSWLFAVTTGTLTSYSLPSGSEIESSARTVYQHLTAYQRGQFESGAGYLSRLAATTAAFRASSSALSDMLLGPIAEKLRQEWKDKRLVIVAPGALQYIPFAALPAPGALNGTPSRLIAQHEIVNVPSASALASIRAQTSGRKPGEKTVAVLADPVFESSDPRLQRATDKRSAAPAAPATRANADASPAEGMAAVSPYSDLTRALAPFAERGGFTRLPFSREEAEAIAALTTKESLLKATDFQANLARATSGDLAQYRIIHFATHGLLNSEHPELSGLVLSLVDERGRPQDGFLRMHEIYNLDLPADLIVLSACQTALGKETKGEGLIGLTRGFMYAGAPRIVASLWQINDLATAELMKRFYRGLLQKRLRPAAALRVAQLELAKDPRWSAPYFWAGFVLQGDWR